MTEDNSVQHTNISEEEMGQLHSIHFGLNAIERIRRSIGSGPSLAHCEDCGEAIPEARRLAVMGCRCCIICQAEREKCR